MKYLFVFLLVGMSFGVIGQKYIYNVRATSIELEETGQIYSNFETVRLKKDNSLVNGLVYHTIEGKMVFQCNFKEGLKDGFCRSWYDSGQLESEENYKEGVVDGLSRDWYRNGQLWFEFNYKAGNLISKKCWDVYGSEIDCPCAH